MKRLLVLASVLALFGGSGSLIGTSRAASPSLSVEDSCCGGGWTGSPCYILPEYC